MPLAFLKNEDDAEEIVQEVFLTVWEKREDLNLSQSFSGYLFTIAKRKSLNYLRNRLYKIKYIEELKQTVIVNHTSVFNDIVFKDYEEKVCQLINELPKKRKTIYYKSRFEGKKIVEIAEELDISPKTVNNQINLAQSFLRNKLEKIIDTAFFVLFYYFV